MSVVKPLSPRVCSVVPLDDYVLLVRFKDGAIKRFDMKPYLHLPVFQRLTRDALFFKAHVQNGTVVWNECVDFSPESLHRLGQPATDIQ